MHFLVDLLFQDSCCCFNCFVRLFRILSAGLSHVRTTAACQSMTYALRIMPPGLK